MAPGKQFWRVAIAMVNIDTFGSFYVEVTLTNITKEKYSKVHPTKSHQCHQTEAISLFLIRLK